MKIEVDAKKDRLVMAALCEVQRAAGNAGMAHLSGCDLRAHIRLIREELDRLEELRRSAKNRVQRAHRGIKPA